MAAFNVNILITMLIASTLISCGGGGTSEGTSTTPSTTNNPNPSVSSVLLDTQDNDIAATLQSSGIGSVSINDVIVQQSTSVTRPARQTSCTSPSPLILVSSSDADDIVNNQKAIYAHPELLGNTDPICAEILYIRQAQQLATLRDSIYRKRAITELGAFVWNVLSAKIIDRVIKYYKSLDANRKIILLSTDGTASGIGMLWLKIGGQQPSMAILLGGRVEPEQTVINRYSTQGGLTGGGFRFLTATNNPAADNACVFIKNGEYFCINNRDRWNYNCNSLDSSATNSTASDQTVQSWVSTWSAFEDPIWRIQNYSVPIAKLPLIRTELSHWSSKAEQASSFDSNSGYNTLSNKTTRLQAYCGHEFYRFNNRLLLQSTPLKDGIVSKDGLAKLSLPFTTFVTTDVNAEYGGISEVEKKYLTDHNVNVIINAGYSSNELLNCVNQAGNKSCVAIP